jgi:hypothetical protein
MVLISCVFVFLSHKIFPVKYVKSNTNQKQLITRSYSVRGDFWGMHRIDFKGLSILGLLTVR